PMIAISTSGMTCLLSSPGDLMTYRLLLLFLGLGRLAAQDESREQATDEPADMSLPGDRRIIRHHAVGHLPAVEQADDDHDGQVPPGVLEEAAQDQQSHPSEDDPARPDHEGAGGR